VIREHPNDIFTAATRRHIFIAAALGLAGPYDTDEEVCSGLRVALRVYDRDLHDRDGSCGVDCGGDHYGRLDESDREAVQLVSDPDSIRRLNLCFQKQEKRDSLASTLREVVNRMRVKHMHANIASAVTVLAPIVENKETDDTSVGEPSSHPSLVEAMQSTAFAAPQNTDDQLVEEVMFAPCLRSQSAALEAENHALRQQLQIQQQIAAQQQQQIAVQQQQPAQQLRPSIAQAGHGALLNAPAAAPLIWQGSGSSPAANFNLPYGTAKQFITDRFRANMYNDTSKRSILIALN
jgi:hypothetical protein